MYDVYSEYYERSVRIHAYAYDFASRVLTDFGEIPGAAGSLNPRLVWSPREDRVLLFLVEVKADSRFSLSIYRSDADSKDEPKSFARDIITSADYFYVTNLFWR